jgi:hypothetical protein
VDSCSLFFIFLFLTLHRHEAPQAIAGEKGLSEKLVLILNFIGTMPSQHPLA